jgi:hypothetical protein
MKDRECLRLLNQGSRYGEKGEEESRDERSAEKEGWSREWWKMCGQ